MIRLGAHMLLNEGFAKVPENARETGCETIQIFSKNPRGWDSKELDDVDITEFKAGLRKLDIRPLVVHSNYLLNLSSLNIEVYEKSLFSLVDELKRAKTLGAEFLVTHIRGFEKDKITEGINSAFGKIENPPKLLLEPVPKLGFETFKFLGEIIKSSSFSKNLGLCFDTCHIYTAGYDFTEKEGMDKMIKEIEKFIGFDKICLMHLNDSKTKCGSKIDRHEHIGKGHIGLKAFSALINNKLFAKIPMIIETPKKEPGDDKKNLKILRDLVK